MWWMSPQAWVSGCHAIFFFSTPTQSRCALFCSPCLLQLGGQLTDMLLVLRSDDAIKAFCNSLHVGESDRCNYTTKRKG